MSDAYRSAGHGCPFCSNPELREFSHRLVCDQCNAMMMSPEDLSKSIDELDGRTGSVSFSDEEATKIACPRCVKPLTKATLTVSHIRLAGKALHCATDGVWVDQGALAGAFALASRRGHAGAAHGTRNYGGFAGPALVGVSGTAAAAMNSIRSAFGSGAPASSGLAISHWGENRPRVHTLFVSAYKDRALGCPACKDTKLQFAGDRWECAACGGCFVEDAALVAMVSEMTNQPWQQPPVAGGPGDRACPVCAKPMRVEVLEAVTIDRCEGHGVYFDPNELQTALTHAAEPHGGVGSFLKRLFTRHHEGS